MDSESETKAAGGTGDGFVSGYTDAEFFNVLDNNINDPGDYKQNLLQGNSNNQSIQVTNLFGEYGY